MPTDDLLSSQEMEDHFRRHRGTALLNVFVVQQVINLTYAVEELLKTMATQEDVQALTDSINQTHQELSDGIATLQAELNSLDTANPDIDLSGAKAAVDSLEQTVAGVKDLAPDSSSAPTGPTGPGDGDQVKPPFTPAQPPDDSTTPPDDSGADDTTDSGADDTTDTGDATASDDTPQVNPEA